jgi:DNA-directed RNA polymerase specialized sigma24 family protein
LTTTKRATWDRRRGTEHERMVATGPAELPAVRDGSTPEEEVSRTLQVQRIQMAAAGLDERCARLLYYLYQDGDHPNYAEIAEKLGLTTGSIGPIRGRCLEKLRRLLEDES